MNAFTALLLYSVEPTCSFESVLIEYGLLHQQGRGEGRGGEGVGKGSGEEEFNQARDESPRFHYAAALLALFS